MTFQKKKILFVLPTLHAGGAENYVLRFIKYIGSDEYEWHVLSLNLTKGDLHQRFLDLDCTIYYRSIGYYNPIKAFHFFKFLKRESFYTICTFNGNFGGVPLCISKLAKVKNRIAWHRRSTDAFQKSILKKMYNKFVNQLIRTNATSVLSNSAYAFKVFYSNYYLTDDRFKIIPNGIDPSDFDSVLSKTDCRLHLRLPLNTFLIGHVGRYDPAKNHETIFKTVQQLKSNGLLFAFVFCGKNTDSADFIKRVRYYNLEDVVFCLGLQEDLSLVYKSLDLFYFPSLTEGQPNALLEAILSGVPIIASNIEPIQEIIPEKFRNRLIAPMDVLKSAAHIECFYNSEYRYDVDELREWTKNYFDHELNFQKFKQELDEK